MSENTEYLEMTGRSRLSANITYLMLKGAGYAAIAVLVLGVGLWVVKAVGTALPEDSKTQPDPINRVELILQTPTTAVA